MATYQSFSHSPTEYAAALTNQTHVTLGWLVNRNYITEEAYEELVSTLIVANVQHHKSWGQKVIEHLFSKESTDDAWVFPLVLVDKFVKQDKLPKPTKPKLEIV
jgi:hypothetical protein